MVHLLYPELSYKILGILFKVHTELGGEFEEKYYQRAVEKMFIKNKISYKRELKSDVIFDGEKIGKYFLDFLVEDRIIVELKAIPKVLPIHFRQVRTYLKVNGLELGIIANFRGGKLTYNRILNKV